MDWFKHYTQSHEDPDISDAWDEFGDSAVVVFWVILEVYGQEFSHLDSEGKLTLSLRYFERKLRRKWSKLEKILKYFQSRNRIYFSKTDSEVTLKIPKFIEVSSNWTKRQKPAPTEAPTEAPQEEPTKAPTAKDLDLEVDLESKEKDLKAAPPSIEILEPETGTLDPEEVERNVIMDMALTLVNDTTIEIANQLSQDGFKKSHEWLQRQRNLHMNPRAMLHTLRQCRIYHPKNPWGYCDKIIKIENGNFNERDSVRNHT